MTPYPPWVPALFRSRTVGSLLILAAFILMSLDSLMPAAGPWALFISLLLVITALLARVEYAVHLSLFVVFLLLPPLVRPSFRAWPYRLLLPLLAYCCSILLIPRLRNTIHRYHLGNLTKEIAFLIAGTSAVSGIALFIWYRALAPDLSLHLAYLEHIPVSVYLLAGIGFSLANAALEEIVFRGVIMECLDAAAGPGMLSLAGQAWLFGASHYLQGFPNGLWGIAMTTVYGAMLGAIRRRSHGLLAPWLAHICADAVIFAILAAVMLKTH